MPDAALERDECIRADSTLEKLAGAQAGLPRRGHGDGRERVADERRRGRAGPGVGGRRRAGGRVAAGPGRVPRHERRRAAPLRHRSGRGGPAARWRRAGLGWGDLAAVELNEAFAAQSLACLAEWPELDPAIVNPQGGAIAIGHPLGCSGARILTTLVHHLRRTGGRYGLAAMCIGVGQGIAVVVENTE